MQKATYYDSSAIYGGYPYQAANGFGYNASQQPYPASAALGADGEYHRPACSLQSPANAGGHPKAHELSEACLRTLSGPPSQPPGLGEPPLAPPPPQAAPPAPQQPQPPQQPPAPAPAAPPPPSSVSPPQNASSNPTPASAAKSPLLNSPTVAKQIFPWMKESRQNTKQKTSGSSSGKGVPSGGGSSGLVPGFPSHLWPQPAQSGSTGTLPRVHCSSSTQPSKGSRVLATREVIGLCMPWKLQRKT